MVGINANLLLIKEGFIMTNDDAVNAEKKPDTSKDLIVAVTITATTVPAGAIAQTTAATNPVTPAVVTPVSTPAVTPIAYAPVRSFPFGRSCG